jgi:hypothetical protein
MVTLQAWASIHAKLLVSKADVPIVEKVVTSLNLAQSRTVATVVFDQPNRGCYLCREARGAASVEPMVVPVADV